MRTGLPAISGEPLFYAQYNAIQNTAAEVRAVCRGFRRAGAELHRRELYPLWGRAWQRQMRAIPEWLCRSGQIS